MAWDAPTAEYYEGDDFSLEHLGQNPVVNLGHGNTCNHCNDAIISDYEKETPGRNTTSFHYGSKKHGAGWILPKKHGGEMDGLY
jgi:hypothetical protein